LSEHPEKAPGSNRSSVRPQDKLEQFSDFIRVDEIFRVFWRQRLVLFGTVLIITSLAAIISFQELWPILGDG